MKRRSEKMSIKKRVAAAILAAALVVGAAGPIVSAPSADNDTTDVAAWSHVGGAVRMLGGSWS